MVQLVPGGIHSLVLQVKPRVARDAILASSGQHLHPMSSVVQLAMSTLVLWCSGSRPGWDSLSCLAYSTLARSDPCLAVQVEPEALRLQAVADRINPGACAVQLAGITLVSQCR